MNKENLYKAIELAQGVGKCEYVVNDKPCCVIAQLITLEGGNVRNIPVEDNGCGIFSLIEKNRYIAELLVKYPKNLLIELQEIWDSNNIEEEAKILMKKVVDNA